MEKTRKHTVPSFTCPFKGFVKSAPGHCLLAQVLLFKRSTVLIKCNMRKYQGIVVFFCFVNFGKQRTACAQEGEWQGKCSILCDTNHCPNQLPGSACEYPDGLSHKEASGNPGLGLFILGLRFFIS